MDQQVQQESFPNAASADVIPLSMETTRALAVQALALTVQDWPEMGQGDDPTVSEAVLFQQDDQDDAGVERVTALLMVRLVALQLVGRVPDLSTSGICRQALLAEDGEPPWPFVTPQILDQLRQFVRKMLEAYSSTNPFHNKQHAVTVVVNCNKLLDLMLAETIKSTAQLDGGRPWTFGLRSDPLPLLALLFAALCHDAGHAGVSNRQLVMENHEKALLYNDQSVQEKHSLHLLFRELLLPEYHELRSALFGDVTAEDKHYDENYRYFRSTVISAVMSTDIASPEEVETTKSKWKEAFGRSQRIIAETGESKGSSKFPVARLANRRGSNFSDISEITTPDMIKTPVRRSSSRRFSGDSDTGRRMRSTMYNKSSRVQPAGRVMQRRLSSRSNGTYGSDFAADSVVMLKANHKVAVHSMSPDPQRGASDDAIDGDYSFSTLEDSVAAKRSDEAPPQVAARSRSGGRSGVRRQQSNDSVDSYESSKQDSKVTGESPNTMQQTPPRKGQRPGRPAVPLRNSPDSMESFQSFAQDSVAAAIAKLDQKIMQRPCSAGRPIIRRRNSADTMESFQSFTQDSVAALIAKRDQKRMQRPRTAGRPGARRRNSTQSSESFAQDSVAARVAKLDQSLLQDSVATGKAKCVKDSADIHSITHSMGGQRPGDSQQESNDDRCGGGDDDDDDVGSFVQDSVAAGIAKRAPRRSASLNSIELAPRAGNEAAFDYYNSGELQERVITGNLSSDSMNSFGGPSGAGESIGINRRRMEGANATRRRPGKPTGDYLVIGGDNSKNAYPCSPLPVGSPYRKNLADFDDVDGDDDESLSLTPPSSEDEYQGQQRQREISALSSLLQRQTLDGKTTRRKLQRRASTGMVSTSRFAALAGLPIAEDTPNIATTSSVADNDLNQSQHTPDSAKYRKRLGIRRSMDFSGETLEIYKRGSMGGISMLSGGGESEIVDEPDYMRASAILEAILRAADVGHYLQGWANMTRWSSRMYFELLKAHEEGRGHDPRPAWFENQIRILDSYLRPLALQLDESGVFGEFAGAMFAQSVDDIRERWLAYGHEITDKLREEAAVTRTKEPR